MLHLPSGRIPGPGIGCCQTNSRASSLRLHSRDHQLHPVGGDPHFAKLWDCLSPKWIHLSLEPWPILVSQSSRCSIRRPSMGCSGLQTIRDAGAPSGARPLLAGRETTERNVTMAPWHFFTHLLLVWLLPVSSISSWLLYILIRRILRPRGSLTNCIGAEQGASGTASRSLPRYADMSHSAEAEKSHLCRGSKQIARPEADLRCGECDGVEMAQRGWRGSDPVSSRRAGSLSR
jgi:hypothetical protein